jgi:two-component system phosphate regulon sensor histidine kinase PhoR
MNRLESLLKLVNAASASGTATVDARGLREMLGALRAEGAVILVLAVAVALLWALLASQRRLAKGATAPDSQVFREGLATQIDEMVRRTNERNNYINSIFSSLEDGLILVDAQNRVVLYNPRAQALLGIGPSVFFEDKEEENSPEVKAILAACGRVTQTKQPERLSLVSASARIFDARVVAITNKYENDPDFGSLAIVNDVTEMRKMESMKKDFVASVSHEFRTPLTLISGFMEMFKTQAGMNSEDRARAFEIVDIETERLKRLVSELLMLSQIENRLPRDAEKVIDIEAVIAQIALSLGKLAEKKGQRLKTMVSVKKGILKGNESWFYEAVKNLVENAIKYTPEEGSISLDARSDSKSVIVEVSDTGIGIALSEHEKIFERFYRVDASRGSGGGGSGLGLALVKDIASFFGGCVELRSEPGKGSTFTLRLPINLPEE